MRKLESFAIVMLVLAALFTTAAKAQDKVSYEVEGPVPWVTYIEGDEDSLLIRQPETDWFPAVENTPLGEGDMLWQASGRSELYLDRSSFIRLDSDTGVIFEELSDSGITLTLTRGAMIAANSSSTDLFINIPGQTVSLARRAEARIRVAEDGSSEVAAIDGLVTVDGNVGSVRVFENRTLISTASGYIPQLTTGITRTAFDRWSDQRDGRYEPYSHPPTTAVTYLPRPVAYSMSVHGIWINHPEYGWVWRPHVTAGWVPYRDGRWMHRPGWGWTWVSYEPWGWYPYHYGRWALVSSGWVWVPVRIHAAWSPALVIWIGGSDYIAWQPLPYHLTLDMVINLQPAVIHTYINPRCITYVHYNDFHRGRYHRYHRDWDGCRNSCHIRPGPSGPHNRHVDLKRHRSPTVRYKAPEHNTPRERAVYVHQPGKRNGQVASRVRYGAPHAGDKAGSGTRAGRGRDIDRNAGRYDMPGRDTPPGPFGHGDRGRSDKVEQPGKGNNSGRMNQAVPKDKRTIPDRDRGIEKPGRGTAPKSPPGLSDPDKSKRSYKRSDGNGRAKGKEHGAIKGSAAFNPAPDIKNRSRKSREGKDKRPSPSSAWSVLISGSDRSDKNAGNRGINAGSNGSRGYSQPVFKPSPKRSSPSHKGKSASNNRSSRRGSK